MFEEAGRRKDRTCERTLSGTTVIRAVRDAEDPALFTFITANYGAGVDWKEWHTFMRYLSQTEAYRKVDDKPTEFTEDRSVNTLTGKQIAVRKLTSVELLRLEQLRQEHEAAAKPVDPNAGAQEDCSRSDDTDMGHA